MGISTGVLGPLVVILGVLLTSQTLSVEADSGYRLARRASYFITAPRKIHPNMVMQMSVSVIELYYDNMNVRSIIRRNNEEIASSNNLFLMPGTQMVQMLIPDNSEQGNYSLRVEGTSNGGQSGYIFWNETDLEFQPKQVAVFIQTNKPFYCQGQKVLFRVMPVKSNLISRSGSMDIYIEDSTGTTVRRWLSMQTNAGGVLDMEFNLSEQPDYGDWKIKVKAFVSHLIAQITSILSISLFKGDWYEKDFKVDEFWVTAIDINVTMPTDIFEDEFGLAGTIIGNLSLGHPVRGTCQVKLEVRLPPGEQEEGVDYAWPTIEKDTRFFPGATDFLFTMKEIEELIGESVAGKELYVEAYAYDWFLVQGATGWAMTVVHSNVVDLELLGDTSRTFKPNQTMDVYYAVKNRDGTRINKWRRQVTVSGSEQSVSGSTTTFEHKFLVGDDGIAHFQYKPKEDAQFIRIAASYDTIGQKSVELTAYRHFSPTNSYIYITSSTSQPMVDHYMVFTVTTNSLVERIFYLIAAGGNIITGDSLEMSTRQKTFSVALSRDMIPQSHIVVWHVYEDEVIADSMNFYVNGTRLNEVDVNFNRGKDFTGDTIEINSWTDPSSYIGFQAIGYDLWAYGFHPFITETDVIRELETFDTLANSSFQYQWRLPEQQDELIHYPAPTYGVDANTTFVVGFSLSYSPFHHEQNYDPQYAGLLVFTDANVTRVTHYCNESTGWHPCMDGTCYLIDQRCDGVRQCIDGQDEMGCVYPVVDTHTPVRDRRGLVTQHYAMVGEWLWAGHFIMPYGRLDLTTDVPDEPMPWVLSAFAISRDLGFGITHTPPR
ncbi:hypothetical protein CAPTEDRAFT_200949, partial [Capitella teleta]